MKTEKHPEYKTWNDAVEATHTIFKTVKFNKPISEQQKQFDPVIAYFGNQLESLSPKDKKAKKHRKAALGNLVQILEALDRHDEAMEWCNKYMKDKKLDKIAKRNMAACEKTKAHLAFMKMESRHIDTNDEVSEDNFEKSELAEDEDEGNE